MRLKSFVLVAATAGLLGGLPLTASVADAGVQATGQTGEQQKPLDLNTATTEQLEKLPGIGPATAKLVVEYREKNGPFKKIEELMNVKGIGEKTFLNLKDRITVVPPKGGGRH
jgi:competence protein ComEA